MGELLLFILLGSCLVGGYYCYTALTERDNQIEDLAKRNDELKNKQKKLKLEVEKAKDESLNERIELLELRDKQWEENVDELLEEIKQHKSKIETLKGQSIQTDKIAEEKYNSLNYAFLKIKEKLDKKEKQIKDIEEKLSSARDGENLLDQIQKSKINNLTSTVEGLRYEQEKLSSIIKEKDQKLEIIKKEHIGEVGKLSHRNEVLEKTFDERINTQLLHYLNKPNHIPRFIHEMYKRGFANQQQRAENLRRAEVLNELQEKSNDHKGVQLVTREEKLRLDIERNNWDVEKSFYQIERQLDSIKNEKWLLNQDRREYEFIRDIEQRETELKNNIARYEIKQQRDELSQSEREMMLRNKEELHKIEKQRSELRLEEKENILKDYNRQIELLYKEKLHALDVKKQFFELEVQKGNFEAERKLADIEDQRRKLSSFEDDLKLSRKELDLLVSGKEQDIIGRELGVKQDLLYSFYDQFVLRNPVEIDKAFARLGYRVDSPYKREADELRKQLAFERQKNLPKKS